MSLKKEYILFKKGANHPIDSIGWLMINKDYLNDRVKSSFNYKIFFNCLFIRWMLEINKKAMGNHGFFIYQVSLVSGLKIYL